MSRRRVLSIITTSTTTPKPTPSKFATRLKAALATTLFCAALLSLPVQEAMASGASAGNKQQPAPAAEAGQRTDITVQAHPDIIRIMVSGKEIATFDAAGLHVNGDVTASGKVSENASGKAAAP